MDGAVYVVLGVFEKRKGGFVGENRQDNVVMIPLKTIQRRYPEADTVILYCRAFAGQREAALFEIESVLRNLRGVKPGAESDFNLSTADSIIEQLDRITAMIRTGTLAISGLGLLVGGIGVMNIMLMSVTQRTREIGVRKAIGARRRDIVLQFLLEAAFLTTTGGVLGRGAGGNPGPSCSATLFRTCRPCRHCGPSLQDLAFRPWSGCSSECGPPQKPRGWTRSNRSATNNRPHSLLEPGCAHLGIAGDTRPRLRRQKRYRA